jgi:hypothetical protein
MRTTLGTKYSRKLYIISFATAFDDDADDDDDDKKPIWPGL